ncbi:MAG: hypothetical protein OEW75_03805, partial [Cyclobacteriaceae bacterium]|nr:hypothetical protein [Cyclobacteriaceae bacterium]
LYNGNISSMEWNSADGTNSDYYNYSYDPMNRLKGADFGGTLVQKFDVSNLNYDLNGNILNLTRNNELGNPMDAMSYTYNDGGGNQLAAVTDAGDDLTGFKDGNKTGDDYTYDANGNLTADKNKGILSIEYNHLNLPVKVTKDANNYIEYIYDAAGTKLAQMVHQESTDAVPVPLPVKTTYYMGEFIYEQLDSSPIDLQLINHEEGRVVKDELGAWEYQYHLKDHLGNVRVTFTTKGPETVEYMATMEFENAVKEEAEFVNADQRINGQSMTSNTTPDGNYSNYADSGKPVGVGIMLEVAKGDVLDISVNAYYSNATSDYSTLNAIGSALAAAFGGFPGGTAEQQVLYNSLTGAFGALGETANSFPSEPAAYLNYYFFDKDMAFIEENSGYRRVSYLANGSPEFISQLKTVDNTGFVYIFVSNLSPSTGDERVYFDDLDVKHTKNSKIMQQDDYYPFGLSFNSWKRSGSLKNKLNTFQDQELIEDLDLGWVQFKWRNHMPEIGRFFNVDPLAEKYVYNSPYAFSENKVISHIELEGLEALHFRDKDGNHVLEKNVVVLLKRTDYKPATNKNYTEKRNQRIIRQTKRLNKQNTADNKVKMQEVKEELSAYFNGSDGHAQNKNKEKVIFKFNVKGMKVDDPTNATRTMATENGEQGVMAAVITQKETNVATTSGNYAITRESETPGAIAHEVGHSLMTREKDEESRPGSNSLMTRGTGGVGGPVSGSEVNKMLEDSVEKVN